MYNFSCMDGYSIVGHDTVFCTKMGYGTLVSLTVLEVKTKITLHNNNVLAINCCGCNKQFRLHLVYILLFELLVILAFVV